MPSKPTQVVQYPDPEGIPAYVLTHWNAVRGKPFDKNVLLLTSPNGTIFQLTVTDKGELIAKEVENGEEENPK